MKYVIRQTAPTQFSTFWLSPDFAQFLTTELSFSCILPQACNILTIVNLTQKLWTDADIDSLNT